MELVRDWMRQCDAKHLGCRPDPSLSNFTPTRLIRITNDRFVALVKPDTSVRMQWCSLSYVWGMAGDSFKTTSANVEAYYRGIETSILPRTIRDAISVCYRIGVPYLWVDSLCIIQDDKEDLRRELHGMPQIYQQARLTIVASCANEASEGFLHKRGFFFKSCPPISIRHLQDNGIERRLTLFEKLGRTSSNEPISNRAWCFQETLLSPRRLEYRSQSLRLVCREHDYTYGLEDITPFLLKDSIDTMPWHELVAAYSARKLTFRSDKLRAIGALARIVAARDDANYMAGLFRDTAISDLCWRLKTPALPRPEEHRGPTWSWISVDSVVQYERNVEHFKKVRARLLRAEIATRYTGGEFDEIGSASLTLTLPIKLATIKSTGPGFGERDGDVCNFRVQVDGHPIPLHGILDALEDEWQDIGNSKELANPVWAGLLGETKGSWVGLLLKRDKESGTFRRIGILDCCEWSDYLTWDNGRHLGCAQKFNSFELGTVTIV
jgi:hypothetical protein